MGSSLVPRVLFVGNGLRGGGAEARLARLASHVFGGQVDVAVLIGDARDSAPGKGGIYCLRWSGRLSYPLVISKLWRLVRREKYDVVVAFGLFPVAVSALALLMMKSRPKLIVSEITRPLRAQKSLGSGRRWLYFHLRRILFARGDLITANSSDGLSEICRIVGVSPSTGVRLPNVVNADSLLAMANEEPPNCLQQDRRYAICIGRLAFMKRVDTVVAALGMTQGHHQLRLVIVGDGEAKQDLLRQIAALGLERRVTMTGHLSNPFPLL